MKKLEKIFSYRVAKDKKIFLYWYGKEIMVLKEKESIKFLERIEGKNDEEKQLIMAKVTKNFKRGNEKIFKNAKKG